MESISNFFIIFDVNQKATDGRIYPDKHLDNCREFTVDNQTVKQQILDKFNNDRYVDAAKIGVMVDNGVVTLTGHVKSMDISARAEALACEVHGVKAVAQEITLDRIPTTQSDDENIAASILSEFHRETTIPEDQLTIHVQDGNVVVKGDVYWLYQKNAVSVTLKAIDGIRECLNQIRVIDKVDDTDLELEIAAVLAKLNNTNPNAINIKCSSGAATLAGTIDSNVERASVIHAVKSVPGVRYVSDQLTVLPS